jgi:hypothetical protein
MIQELAFLQQAASQASSAPNVWTLIVGALISTVFGVLAGWIGAYLKVKAENFATKEEFDQALGRLAASTRTVGEENARIARDTALAAELREAVRQFAVAAGALIHSMCWLTWDCIYRKRVDAKMVGGYDEEAHRQLPIIMAQLAVIAMLSRDAHAKLSPFADEIIALDARVGAAMVGEEREAGSQREVVEACYADSGDLEDRFRHGVADLFHDDAGATPRVPAERES